MQEYAQLEQHYRCKEKPLTTLPHHPCSWWGRKEKPQCLQPFSKPAAARQEKSETKIALEAHRNMDSPHHRYFWREQTLKYGQVSHWCKHMDSLSMWALELHGYKFWQSAQLGCSRKWAPNCAQIQVVGSPLCLEHDFPSPALPTGLSAEHVHMAGCLCQMAGTAPSSQSILARSGTPPEEARWHSTAPEHCKILVNILTKDQ